MECAIIKKMQLFGASSKLFKSVFVELLFVISSIESIIITLYFDSMLVLYVLDWIVLSKSAEIVFVTPLLPSISIKSGWFKEETDLKIC